MTVTYLPQTQNVRDEATRQNFEFIESHWPTGRPSYVTTLPASPADGQEVYYVADAAKGILWHLRYNSGVIDSSKWEFVGGPAIVAYENTTTTIGTANTWLGNQPPQLTVPLAGYYRVRIKIDAYNPTGGQATFYLGTERQGNPGATFYTATSGGQVSLQPSVGALVELLGDTIQVPAGEVFRTMVYVTSTGLQFFNKYMEAMPIRFG